MMEQNAIIRARNLVKSYTAFPQKGSAVSGGTPILQGVTLDVLRGEFLAIIGASGAGKSTLLHLLGALDSPDEGGVELILSPAERYAYESLSNENLSTLRNAHIGFIFQFHHLLPEFTAKENVMMPALIAGISYNAAEEKASELLKQVGLQERSEHKPDALSGGEQQRVAFARSLVNNPAVVFADEPTGNLDHANSERIFELIRHFRERNGQTFVIVTHSRELAGRADRTLSLTEGLLQSVSS